MASVRELNRKTRQRRVRRAIRGSDEKPRLSVYRSLHHMYVQVISDQSGRTLAAVGTNGGDLKQAAEGKHGVERAKLVGKTIAERCLQMGITAVVFDRNGFLYHGKVKALAEAAREGGLRF
ncbi:MAG: 50S ribosomal protein L18 [Candidatus Binataceae bacterium]